MMQPKIIQVVKGTYGPIIDTNKFTSNSSISLLNDAVSYISEAGIGDATYIKC